jgi:protein-disulfide isomerase
MKTGLLVSLLCGCAAAPAPEPSPPAVVAASDPGADSECPGDAPEPECDAPPTAAAALAAPAVTRESIPTADAPRLGPADAPVVIVFAADLACGYCARAERTMRQLADAYGDRVAIVFEHHPLPMHPEAVGAAIAAEAAREQGKFWEMAEIELAHRDQLDRGHYLAWARSLGLDLPSFTADLDAPDIARRVAADRDRMSALGAKGAPTFWINGRRLVGAYPLETFRSLVDAERGQDLPPQHI